MKTVDEVLRLGPLEVSKKRLQFFQRWNQRARELDKDEQAMRNTMDPLVERAVSGKRISLFEEMLRFYDYPDLEVAEVPKTSMLPSKFTPAVITREPLQLQAKMRRNLITTKLIDDFSESSVNQAVTVSETPVLHTVDVACALVSFMFKSAAQLGESSELLVRTFDLSSAYRQIDLNEEGRSMAFIRVYGPHSQQLAFFRRYYHLEQYVAFIWVSLDASCSGRPFSMTTLYSVRLP
eukprot:s3022_g9.t1